MDVKLINPFVDAVAAIMPQLGFQQVSKGKLAVQQEDLIGKGVTVLIGMTHDVRGNIAYNMTDDTAKAIASVMMMGMPVEVMDEMAQSAISEMVNMITANAATQFEKQKIIVDISPPSMAVGEGFRVKVGASKYLVIEILIDAFPIELSIAVDQ